MLEMKKNVLIFTLESEKLLKGCSEDLYIILPPLSEKTAKAYAKKIEGVLDKLDEGILESRTNFLSFERNALVYSRQLSELVEELKFNS